MVKRIFLTLLTGVTKLNNARDARLKFRFSVRDCQNLRAPSAFLCTTTGRQFRSRSMFGISERTNVYKIPLSVFHWRDWYSSMWWSEIGVILLNRTYIITLSYGKTGTMNMQLVCKIAAKRVEKACCAFYQPRSNLCGNKSAIIISVCLTAIFFRKPFHSQ